HISIPIPHAKAYLDIFFFIPAYGHHRDLPSFPTRRSSDLSMQAVHQPSDMYWAPTRLGYARTFGAYAWRSLLNTGVRAERARVRSEEHTSELQSRGHLVCRLLLEKKKRDRRETAGLHVMGA